MLGFLKNIFLGEDLSTKILHSLVREIAIFSNLSDSQIDIITKLFVLKNYKHGDIIVTQGEKPPFVGVVQDGTLEVFKNVDGANVKLGEINKNGIYAEMSYFNNAPSMATLRVSKNLISWEISTQNFDKFLSMNPDVLTHIKNVISQRIKSNNEKMEQIKKDTESYARNIPAHQKEIDNFIHNKPISNDDGLPKIVIDFNQ